MDFTLFLFLEVVGIFFLLYGMGFSHLDVRFGLTVVSTLIFYMLSIASWDVTRDFVEVITINASITQYTVHYVMPEMSSLNTVFMWISILWMITKVLYNAEEMVSVLKFKFSMFSRRMVK